MNWKRFPFIFLNGRNWFHEKWIPRYSDCDFFLKFYFHFSTDLPVSWPRNPKKNYVCLWWYRHLRKESNDFADLLNLYKLKLVYSALHDRIHHKGGPQGTNSLLRSRQWILDWKPTKYDFVFKLPVTRYFLQFLPKVRSHIPFPEFLSTFFLSYRALPKDSQWWSFP